MTELLFGFLFFGGVMMLVVAGVALVTTRHLPRLDERVRIALGLIVSLTNLVIAVAWFVEKDQVWGTIPFAFLGAVGLAYWAGRLRARYHAPLNHVDSH
jgi:hypothetical protein